MTLKEQGKGYFRKSKAYGLVCGIALAGALVFSARNVSADEVTTPTDSQPSTEQANVQGIKLFGGVSGDADKAVEAFINETLDYNPDVKCSHHEHSHGEGHTCGEHGCGSHSCH